MNGSYKGVKRRIQIRVSGHVGPLKWLSPVYLSSLHLFFAFVSILLPKGFYEQVMNEPDYMFLNVRVGIFVLIMWSAFAFGAFLAKIQPLSYNSIVTHAKIPTPKAHVITAILFLLVALVFSLVRLFVLIRGLSFDVILLSLRGDVSSTQLRLMVPEVFEDTSLGFVFPLTLAVLAWSFWVGLIGNNTSVFGRLHRITYWGLFCAVIMAYLFEPFLLQIRGPLFILVFTLTFIWVLYLWYCGKLTARVLLRDGMFLIFFGLLVFVLVALQRKHLVIGESFFESAWSLVVGYFPAAYNRLAAIVDGLLILPNSGSGFYTLGIVWHFPLIAKMFGFSEIGRSFGLDLPDSGTENWIASFVAVWQAGLNGSFNWFTVFGCAYADYGWMAWLWFLLYGFVSQVAWNRFLKATPWGVIFYPWVAVSILSWWGAYNVLIARAETVIIALAPLATVVVTKNVACFMLRRSYPKRPSVVSSLRPHR